MSEKGSDHYLKMAIQPFDVIDTWPIDQRIGFYRGNLLKYTLRLGSKDAAISEAKKAQHYAEKLVEALEQESVNKTVNNLQGNDLKVSICDTMNLADSFLKDIRASELAYAENQHKTLWTEADEERAGIIALNGNEGDHYKVFMSLRESRSHEWLDHEDEEAQA